MIIFNFQFSNTFCKIQCSFRILKIVQNLTKSTCTGQENQIALESHFEGNCTSIFNVILEFQHEQGKILLKKRCFSHEKILM